jgi:cytochrome P450 / NADPH-cytochrome P450 reductase
MNRLPVGPQVPGRSLRTGPTPPLVVWFRGSGFSLRAGPEYLVGRDPGCDVVIPDGRVSRYHAVLRLENGRWVLADNDSANGLYAGARRVDRIEILRECQVRFAEAADAPVLSCSVQAVAPEPGTVPLPGEMGGTGRSAGATPRPVIAPPDDGPLEIPYAVRWLVPRGERFANFDVLNDNDTQLDYFCRFGHIYAVGVPTKKWRLVVVSDPALLDEVSENEDQFGKHVEEINFFAQLSNSRGGGISVISDGEHAERIRRVMLPWYSSTHQRTQLEMMKEQARKLIAAWSTLPDEQPVDARTWMERYALEVSGRGGCAYDFGLLDGHGNGDIDPHAFAAAVPASTKESILRVAEPRPDFTLFAGRARRARRKAYRRHNQELVATADALVRARMHTCPLGQPTDLLSRLVSTADPDSGEVLDAETIRDQILMHLSNGFNGPSITAAWLTFVLATRPEIEATLIAEIDGITGGDPDYDMRYDDLGQLTYTTQVIKEALRIYPPMPITIRRSLTDGMLGRYRIRKGDIILVGALAAQRDPRYWGPVPDRFDPDQFAPDKVADRPRHAFIPFSIGRRQCMAQEITFMMLRVVLFEIYRRYRLRLPPGATVSKNTVVTTKPAAVPVIRIPRGPALHQPAPVAVRERPDAPARAGSRAWGEPAEIPPSSAYRHLVIAFGSNFGASKELAERFAERGDFHGYTSEVMTLDELASSPPRTRPWLLTVLTSTYTGNPPSNATAFKSWLEQTASGSPTWHNCRYLVWGLGNSQWNAFLAFPRYVHQKLSQLGATPLADLGYGDVGSPAWEHQHADWDSRVWPALLRLSGARPTNAAAARVAAEESATEELTGTDSTTAMWRSLHGDHTAAPPATRPAGQMLVPTILSNAVGIATLEAHVLVGRELQAAQSPRRTRHLEISLPPGTTYQAGDHLGVCPQNDPERVERVARHLDIALDGLFQTPKTMNVRTVPKSVVLQVRNVLTNLVDIGGRPTVGLLDLLQAKATDPAHRSRLAQIRHVMQTPDGPDSPLRAAINAGGYDTLALLDEFPSCAPNIFEFLHVMPPLRPRYYSTSSSPAIHGDHIAHLTVSLDTSPVPGMPDRDFRGTSSHYLHTLRAGDRLDVFLDSASGFHLQTDVTKPMIFVSAGTGFAPMRAFLWERLALKREGAALAEAALFNGIRSTSHDYLYRHEIGRFATEGVLNHVHVATSREPPERRDHVQDRIRAHGALVWRLLTDGGYIYICGAPPMRQAVRAALVDVIAAHGSMPREHAETYLAELDTTARYRPDLWG